MVSYSKATDEIWFHNFNYVLVLYSLESALFLAFFNILYFPFYLFFCICLVFYVRTYR